MIIFWSIIILMTLLAVGIFFFPLRHWILLKPGRAVAISLGTTFSLGLMAGGLYWKLGASQPLTDYLLAEKKQAQIVAELARLGSVENIIAQLKQRVEQHPDSRGWYLLGRLYLQTQQFELAAQAFEKAKSLLTPSP